MRHALILTVTLALAASAVRADELYEKLSASHKAELAKVRKSIENFLKHDRISTSGERNATKSISKRVDALDEIMKWIENSEKLVGVDLQSKHETILRLILSARDKEYDSKARGGRIQYVKDDDARGVDRFEYAIWIPKGYKAKWGKDGKNGPARPAIISLHGRAIDQRHPAFRGNSPNERGRKAIYNNWLKHPAADSAIVLAPTGDPKGFRSTEDTNGDDIKQIFHALRTVLMNYRVDYNRVFLDVEGSAIRAACQYPALFAGVIVRDYIEDRRAPALPPEEWFILQNLNGLPLVYIADEKNWDKVGKPFSEALTAAYEKANAKSSLLIIKAKRDNNEQLRAEDQKVAEFIAKHVRRGKLQEFKWRFPNSFLAHPLPVDLGRVNYSYDEGVALEKAAGSLHYKYSLVTEKDKDGKDVAYNLIEIKVTEVESLSVHFYDGVVDLGLPVTIKVNGNILKDKITIERNWRAVFDIYAPTNMLMLPYMASVTLEFEAVPQYTAPAPKDEDSTAGNTDTKDG